MCQSMVNIQFPTAEIRRGKKRRRRKKKQDENIMVCPITKGDHKESDTNESETQWWSVSPSIRSSIMRFIMLPASAAVRPRRLRSASITAIRALHFISSSRSTNSAKQGRFDGSVYISTQTHSTTATATHTTLHCSMLTNELYTLSCIIISECDHSFHILSTTKQDNHRHHISLPVPSWASYFEY